MGLFDYVTVRGPSFVCSEGHDLSGEEFQTKDFGCEMGQVFIEEHRRATTRKWCLGTPEAESDVVSFSVASAAGGWQRTTIVKEQPTVDERSAPMFTVRSAPVESTMYRVHPNGARRFLPTDGTR